MVEDLVRFGMYDAIVQFFPSESMIAAGFYLHITDTSLPRRYHVGEQAPTPSL